MARSEQDGPVVPEVEQEQTPNAADHQTAAPEHSAGKPVANESEQTEELVCAAGMSEEEETVTTANKERVQLREEPVTYEAEYPDRELTRQIALMETRVQLDIQAQDAATRRTVALQRSELERIWAENQAKLARRKQGADIFISVGSIVGGAVLVVAGVAGFGYFLAGAGLSYTAWKFVGQFYPGK